MFFSLIHYTLFCLRLYISYNYTGFANIPTRSLKLCMMGDLVPPNSTLVGVDISTQRISLCKNIVKKYHIDEITSGYCSAKKMVDDDDTTTEQLGNNSSAKIPLTSRVTIRLFCSDGTTFGMQDESSNKSDTIKKQQRGLVFDSNASILENQSKGKRKRMNKSARAREKRRLMELQQREEEERTESYVSNSTNNDADGGFNQQNSAHVTDNREAISTEKKEVRTDSLNDKKSCNDSSRDAYAMSVHAFDRVLVDAECSTDGALRHRSIEKQQQNHSSAATPPPRSSAWDDTNMNELIDLQKRLIESGFRLLKRGGIMVYSTCSLSSKQNEQVVHWLLDKYKDTAYIIPVSFSAESYDNTSSSSQELSFIEEGSISGTVRFNPTDGTTETSCQIDCIMPGSRFFLAKIGKR